MGNANGPSPGSPGGLILFLGSEKIQHLFESVGTFLGVSREVDDALLALRLGLRDGQVFHVVLGDPHVDEVGAVARGDTTLNLAEIVCHLF